MSEHRSQSPCRPRARFAAAPIAGVLLAFLAGSAGAQDPAAAPADAPMYRVEIVVFRNLSPNARPEDPGRPPMPPPVALTDPLGTFADDPDAGPGQTPSDDTAPVIDETEQTLFFTPTDEFTLDEAFARLRRSSAYRPLAHAAWIQPGLEEGRSQPVSLTLLTQVRRVQSGSRPAADAGVLPEPLTGDVTLHRNRFLHLGLDLALTDEDGARYELRGSRRIRSGEINFFDAPELGVIALVTPFES
jgi:hypothetical protein